MSTDVTEQVLDYPLSAPAALDPPEEWARLRQGCPMAKIRLPSGDQAVLLTRYDDVRQVLADPRFSRNLAQEGAAQTVAQEGGGVFEKAQSESLTQADRHQQWRRIISKWFTVKRLNAMQPRIEAMTEQLVDEMVQHGAPADLLRIIGFPLPIWVICDLLGIPVTDRDKLSFWSNTFLSMTRYTREEIDKAQMEFAHYFMGQIAMKRAQPGDDLLSDLITATDHEDKLSERELLMTAQGILVAGHETTSNMIGKMLGMLLAERRYWEQLVADPSLVRTAVEETLRFDANGTILLPRFVTEEVELSGGHKLPRGTTAICNISAANRDEKAFDRADQMDLTRAPNTHIAFGTGAYSCIGQPLARTELQTVLHVLLRRLPSLELAVESKDLARNEGLLVGGLEKLLVRW